MGRSADPAHALGGGGMKALARGWCDLIETRVIVRLDNGEVWRHGVDGQGNPFCVRSGSTWRKETAAAKRYAEKRKLVEMPRKVAKAYAMIE